MEIRKILVPIEFHQGSAASLERAVELASKLGAEITVLHVWQMPVYGFPVVGTSIPVAELGKTIETSARQALEELVKEHEGQGVQLRTMLRVGTPWEQILEVAKELDADLIVMATHGRKGVPRALLGSVAEKVIRMSSVPVLTFRVGEA